MKKSIVFAFAAFGLVACDKSSKELEAKLNQLEKQASAATERQKQLEIELAEQKIMAERDAIERERTLIEEERLAMQEAKNSNKSVLEKIEKREQELSKREEKIWKSQDELDSRQSQISGAERRLNQNDLSQAGRRPLRALPATQKIYTSGPTGDYRNFYEPLGSYGSWFQTRDFGYVYQPTVVRDLSWRPYTRGRWAFTNQGWTWVSNEPFGWACYHYGRWAQLRGHGWVWVPGSQWAPAWVTWRESSGHIGWAPLPPETLAWRDRSWDSSVEVNFRINRSWFSFVSYRHFGNNIQPYCLPAAQNTVIYQNTTNITNYNIQQNNVFVGGPSYQNVTQQIGRQMPIQTLNLDQNPDFGRGGRVLGSKVQGDTLQMVAPNMDAEWNSALVPTKVGDELGKVEVERTEQLAPEVKEEFREYQGEQVKEAKALVSEAGGIKAFEQERTEILEQGREEVAKIEQIAQPNIPLTQTEPAPTQSVESAPKVTIQETAAEPETKRQDPAPSIAQKEPEDIENTKAAEPEKITQSSEPEKSVVKTEEMAEPKQSAPVEREQIEEPKVAIETPEPEAPTKSTEDRTAQADAEEKAQAQAERQAQLQAQQEALANAQAQKEEQAAAAQEAAQAKQEEEKEAIARQREEQQERAREQQEEQKSRLEQQERAREQQEQEQAAREQAQAEAKQEQLRAQQEEQQERVRAQQEEQQRRQEQQERLQEQQEQQERMRAQQEEQQRRQEQQERLREQQEQQERMRAQQEEQQRRQEQQEQMRAQQEEMMRRQQEQQERIQQQQEQMRAQQEEQMRRQQEQQQQQQQPSFGE